LKYLPILLFVILSLSANGQSLCEERGHVWETIEMSWPKSCPDSTIDLPDISFLVKPNCTRYQTCIRCSRFIPKPPDTTVIWERKPIEKPGPWKLENGHLIYDGPMPKNDMYDILPIIEPHLMLRADSTNTIYIYN
jgi:hypothetical protein